MRFLHTSDWQLGMTRHFLAGDDQAAFSQARIDVIVRMAHLARDRGCAFVVVAGDVFETNQPDQRTVGRTLDALAAFTVPVYLLPGNHDPDDPGSVYRRTEVLDRCPAGVEVLDDDRPRVPVPGVEVIGAPWTSKRPLTDLVADACARLPADGARRIVVGHGAADQVVGAHDAPGTIAVDRVDQAIEDGRVRYVALGDRHSTLSVGRTGRLWYSGAPEPTSYREDAAGNVLVVDLDDPIEVTPVGVGRWRFLEVDRDIDGDEDLTALLDDLDSVDDRARTIVKIKVNGVLSLRQAARLERELEARTHVFGALEHPERHRDITIAPTDVDLDELAVTGYAATARDRLRARVTAGGPEASAATDALALLVRLVEEGTR